MCVCVCVAATAVRLCGDCVGTFFPPLHIFSFPPRPTSVLSELYFTSGKPVNLSLMRYYGGRVVYSCGFTQPPLLWPQLYIYIPPTALPQILFPLLYRKFSGIALKVRYFVAWRQITFRVANFDKKISKSFIFDRTLPFFY